MSFRLERVFHIVDARNWEGVRRDGLLPASALIARAMDGDMAAAEQCRFRADQTVLPGGVVLRDQAPMPPQSLVRCLHGGISPEEWYRLINRGVFFWADETRLARHLRALRKTTRFVLEFDGMALAQANAPNAFVTAFNLGAALRRPAPRSAESFVPFRDWQREGWKREFRPNGKPRPASHRPAELVIRAPVPDAMARAISICEVPPQP